MHAADFREVSALDKGEMEVNYSYLVEKIANRSVRDSAFQENLKNRESRISMVEDSFYGPILKANSQNGNQKVLVINEKVTLQKRNSEHRQDPESCC